MMGPICFVGCVLAMALGAWFTILISSSAEGKRAGNAVLGQLCDPRPYTADGEGKEGPDDGEVSGAGRPLENPAQASYWAERVD